MQLSYVRIEFSIKTMKTHLGSSKKNDETRIHVMLFCGQFAVVRKALS